MVFKHTITDIYKVIKKWYNVNMKAVNFNFKMDQQIKCALEEFANKVGMTMSSVLNVCAINIVKNQKLPFTIETESTRTNKE
ncbi:hypothetical protein FACS189459_6000 [Bacilli bacterium]|nr:hypothetical protein FACS189459_6000 [Bacilli bacterium]